MNDKERAQLADDNLKAVFCAAQNTMNAIGESRMEHYEDFKEVYDKLWADFRLCESRLQQLEMANAWAASGELETVEHFVKIDLEYASILAYLKDGWHIVKNEVDDSSVFIYAQT